MEQAVGAYACLLPALGVAGMHLGAKRLGPIACPLLRMTGGCCHARAPELEAVHLWSSSPVSVHAAAGLTRGRSPSSPSLTRRVLLPERRDLARQLQRPDANEQDTSSPPCATCAGLSHRGDVGGVPIIRQHRLRVVGIDLVEPDVRVAGGSDERFVAGYLQLVHLARSGRA